MLHTVLLLDPLTVGASYCYLISVEFENALYNEVMFLLEKLLLHYSCEGIEASSALFTFLSTVMLQFFGVAIDPG